MLQSLEFQEPWTWNRLLRAQTLQKPLISKACDTPEKVDRLAESLRICKSSNDSPGRAEARNFLSEIYHVLRISLQEVPSGSPSRSFTAPDSKRPSHLTSACPSQMSHQQIP